MGHRPSAASDEGLEALQRLSLALQGFRRQERRQVRRHGIITRATNNKYAFLLCFRAILLHHGVHPVHLAGDVDIVRSRLDACPHDALSVLVVGPGARQDASRSGAHPDQGLVAVAISLDGRHWLQAVGPGLYGAQAVQKILLQLPEVPGGRSPTRQAQLAPFEVEATTTDDPRVTARAEYNHIQVARHLCRWEDRSKGAKRANPQHPTT
mmetsp:Transcript_118936/g.341709  ORF Transcript_118936/g.341709 Transcript_118936/m.341709 type:complete len:210 (-) Transcript_118936:38-667(-)